MPVRARKRMRLHWPYCCGWGHWHHSMYGPYGPSPPWWGARVSPEEEKEAIQEYIESLKEEIEAAEEHLKGLEKSE